jgi:hypothetical protein
MSWSLRELINRVPGSTKTIQISTQTLTANMAEQEEDFSSLPLPDRFQHKVYPALLDDVL